MLKRFAAGQRRSWPRSSSRYHSRFRARRRGRKAVRIRHFVGHRPTISSPGLTVEKRQIELHEPIRALGVYRFQPASRGRPPEIKFWVIKQWALPLVP